MLNNVNVDHRKSASNCAAHLQSVQQKVVQTIPWAA